MSVLVGADLAGALALEPAVPVVAFLFSAFPLWQRLEPLWQNSNPAVLSWSLDPTYPALLMFLLLNHCLHIR